MTHSSTVEPCVYTPDCHRFRPGGLSIVKGLQVENCITEDARAQPQKCAGFIFFAVDEGGSIRIERGGDLDNVLQAISEYLREVKKIW